MFWFVLARLTCISPVQGLHGAAALHNHLGILFSPFFPFSLQSVDFEAVAVTVKELVNYALTINSNNHFWLIIQADIYFGKQRQYLFLLHAWGRCLFCKVCLPS